MAKLPDLQNPRGAEGTFWVALGHLYIEAARNESRVPPEPRGPQRAPARNGSFHAPTHRDS